MKRLRSKLTYANVISTLCLFLVLGGGAAVAAGAHLPKNSVGTRALKPEAVTGAKVKAGSLSATAFEKGVIPNSYTKPESDSRFSTKTEATALAARSFSKAESDGRYLRGTITVSASIPPVAADSFQTGSVNCPAGFQAIGGGVDPFGVFFGKVSESAPSFNGTRALGNSGQLGPATGWVGAISTQGAGTGVSGASTITVICSPIG